MLGCQIFIRDSDHTSFALGFVSHGLTILQENRMGHDSAGFWLRRASKSVLSPCLLMQYRGWASFGNSGTFSLWKWFRQFFMLVAELAFEGTCYPSSVHFISPLELSSNDVMLFLIDSLSYFPACERCHAPPAFRAWPRIFSPVWMNRDKAIKRLRAWSWVMLPVGRQAFLNLFYCPISRFFSQAPGFTALYGISSHSWLEET